jgi:hypothetical protein
MPSDLPHGKTFRHETLKISATWKTGSVFLTVSPVPALPLEAK